MGGYFNEEKMDIIDMISYDSGYVNGYTEGRGDGYEVGYEDCAHVRRIEKIRENKERSHNSRQRLYGYLLLIITVISTRIIGDATAAFILVPAALGLIFEKQLLEKYYYGS